MKRNVRNQKLSLGLTVRLVCSLALLAGSLPSAFAANSFFSGAAGTAWDATTTSDWSATTGGPYSSLWISGNTAVFEGTAGTVNVSGSDIPTCGGIKPTVTGYTLSGGQLNWVNGSHITAGSSSIALTINSVIADNGSASSVTANAVSFSDAFNLNALNTFTGPFTMDLCTVNFNTLDVGGNPSSFGAGTTAIQFGTGGADSFSSTAQYTGNGGGTDRPILLATSGSSGFNNNGFGAISFNNTGSAIGGSTLANRTLALGGNFTATANTFCGMLTNMTGFNTTLKINSATWAVLGNNSHSGGTYISGSSGTLQITNDAALGSATNGVIFSAGGTLAAVNLGASTRNDVTIAATRTITVSNNVTANFKTPDTNNLIVAGYITGPGGVSKAGTSYALGTVRFGNDTNNFTGAFGASYGNTEFTSVANSGTPSSLGLGITNSGTIVLGNFNSFGTFRYVGTNNSSTTRPLNWTATTGGYALDVTNTGTIAYLNTTSNLVSGAGAKTLTLQGSNTGTNTLAQMINDSTGGATSLSKSGSGKWVLAGANTYSGTTTISGGTLTVSSDANLGTVPGSATPGSLILNGGALSASASFTLNANRGIALGPTSGSGSGTLDTASGQTLAYAGVIADNGGSGTLVKTGAGTLTLSGAITYTGNTTISAGTLALTSSGTVGAGNVNIGAGATFDVSGLGGGYTLVSGQSLVATNGAVATVKGSMDVTSAAVLMTNVINTPTFSVTSGTLTLGSGTLFTVNINNGGAPLAAGNYKLIAKGAGGSVAGTIPSAVTVGGDGLATGATAVLNISSGELYLVVSGGTLYPPVISGLNLVGGQSVLSFTGTNGQTWKVLTSTNLALPLANWGIAATGTFTGAGVTYTNPAPFDPKRFYLITCP